MKCSIYGCDENCNCEKEELLLSPDDGTDTDLGGDADDGLGGESQTDEDVLDTDADKEETLDETEDETMGEEEDEEEGLEDEETEGEEEKEEEGQNW